MLFSLRAEIRAKLQAGAEPQPAKLADALADEVPSKYLRLALSQALPYLVRDEIRKVRHQALGRRGTVRGTKALDAIAADPRPEDGQVSEGARARGGTAAFTIFQVPVSFGPGHWKYLGDCTREEILKAAEHLAKCASENQARADGYQELAAYMDDRGAAVVKELEPGKVRELVKPEETVAA